MTELLASTRALSVLGAVAAALLGVGYGVTRWHRYRRASQNGQRDRLLDRFMPTYDVAERHEIDVAAPVSLTFESLRAMDLQRSRLVRAIFRGRELILGSEPTEAPTSESFLAQALRIGWGELAEDPGREIVLGAITQPWEANVRFRSLPPREFLAFAEPGYVKIVWTLEAEPRGPAASVARTETRAATTDVRARRRFRRYWSSFWPGILLIRRQALRLVKADAEGRYRAAGVPPAAR